MNCEQVRDVLPVYVESDPSLTASERNVVAGHLETCAECAGEAEALREQIALLRGAGEWARRTGGRAVSASRRPLRSSPGAARNGRRRARRGRSRVGWVAAAAALLLACLAGWALRGGGDSAAKTHTGRLLEGELIRGGRSVGVLVAGHDYTVPDRASATLKLTGGATMTVSAGSSFRLSPDFETRPQVHLLRGQMRCASGEPFEVSGSRIRAMVCGSFALAARESSAARTEAAPPSPIVAAGWTDWIFPPAVAAEAVEAVEVSSFALPEAFILLSGWAEVSVNGSSFRLESCSALVGGDASRPGVGEPGRLVADMAAERTSLLQGLLSPRYRSMVAEYSARAVRYREERNTPGLSPGRLAELVWRTAIADEMRDAHSARLSQLAAEEGSRLRRADLLTARIDVLCDLKEASGRDEGAPVVTPAAEPETAAAGDDASPARNENPDEGGTTK